MVSSEELLNSIRPDMKLTKNFFMRIYGYEISFPGFAENALLKLEEVGCSKAREYYQRFVEGYEQEKEKTMKNVAEWYRKQDFTKKKEVCDCKQDYTMNQLTYGTKKSMKKLQETEHLKADLHQKSDSELLTLLQKLKAENAL